MRVNLAVGCVDHQPLIIGIHNENFEHLSPNPFVSPTAKPLINRIPVSIARGHIAPWRSGAQHPKHSIHKTPIICRYAAPLARLSR
jgi:hypothetical protein